MKKIFTVVGLLFVSLSVFAQSIDKSQYKAIDLFSYKVEGNKEGKDYSVKYKMVLRFGFQSGTTVYFADDDGDTISFEASKKWSFMRGHVVTVYFTADHRAYGSWLKENLIDIEPSANSGVKAYIDECVSLLGKPVPSGFRRAGRDTYHKTVGDDISLVAVVKDNTIVEAKVEVAFLATNEASQFNSFFYTFFEDNKWEYGGTDNDGDDIYHKNGIYAYISTSRRAIGVLFSKRKLR